MGDEGVETLLEKYRISSADADRPIAKHIHAEFRINSRAMLKEHAASLRAEVAQLKDSLEILGQRGDLEKMRADIAEEKVTQLQREVAEDTRWVMLDAVKKHELGLDTHGDGVFYNKRAEAAEAEVARLQLERTRLLERLTHISFVVTGNDAALIDCDPKQADTSLKSYGETLAEAEVARLERERDEARETSRELNRRNGELQRSLNLESGRKAWYGYWRAAFDLFGDAMRKKEAVE